MDLADLDCVPCRAGTPPLRGHAVQALAAQLPAWSVIADHHLDRSWRMADFQSGLRLVDAIGALAEQIGHHPDLTLSWGRVGVQIHTHAIDGLSESDFVLAAKIERLARQHGAG